MALRILSVARHPVGGIRTYLKTMYGLLASEGHRFKLLLVEEPEARMRQSAAAAQDLEQALAGPAFEHVRVPHERAFLSLTSAISRALAGSTFDVIHAHGFTAGAATAAANVLHRVPQVLTVHETLPAESFHSTAGRARRLGLTELFRRMDVLQAVSDDGRANLLASLPRVPADRVVVIPNGIDVERFAARTHGDRAAWRAAHGIGRDQVLFGFLGRLMPEKGYTVLVEAVARLAADPATHGRFAVMVVNDGCFIRELQSDLQSRGLSSCFRFVGLLPDVSDILGRLDAVVMPSLREAGPLVPMEALVAGRPLIASTCVGLREVIAGTPALPVIPGDAGSLAAAMRRVLEAPAAAARAAEAYAPIARERYDARRAAAMLDGMLRGVSPSIPNTR